MVIDNYSYDDIIGYLEDIKDLRILTIGESIIDEYQYGYTLGKAGKFPIVAFKNEKLESYDGGIIAICNHLKDFCDIECMTGDNIIIKKRYVQNEQKLFETYRNENRFNKDIKLLNIGDYDLVIVADFGHGFIDKKLRDVITEKANYIALNVQMNAGNMGLNSINKYEKADYICVSEHEFRLAMSNQFDNLEDIIRDEIEEDIVISITKGKDGSLIYSNGKIVKIPAFEKHTHDSVGAGDTFLAITSPLVYNHTPLENCKSVLQPCQCKS